MAANILLIDTASSVCHVGLLQGERLWQRSLHEAFKHAEQLTSTIDGLMQESGLAYAQLDAVAVTGGPGSYTGLRIGAATAKGICFGTGAKLLALNTLEVMCEGFKQAHANLPADAVFIPMLDARRMEVFTMVQDSSGQTLLQGQALVLEANSYEAWQDQPCYFFGDGAGKFKNLFEKPIANFYDALYLNPEAMATLAKRAFALGNFESVAYYRPDYHKDFYTPAAK
ncbi:MAG: tRNA (adenosine(37)-N6)-threonylcarbamoyltransferase complex dimerization subunit type 1 TsaB [Sphingobacteriaceae bacterium]|nr:tRNA (adenosine(37)-N6)-threonylcarbamoyltransferase complex dimerization subunit type 1 TsaB [Sphingobacteriaceae bacterium]